MRGGGVRGLSQRQRLCTWSPNKLWRSNSIFWLRMTWNKEYKRFSACKPVAKDRVNLLWPYCRALIKTMLIFRWSGLNFNSKMFRQDEKPVSPPPSLSPDSSPSLPKKNYLGMERKDNEASSAFYPLIFCFRKCYISNFLTKVKNTIHI